MDNPTQNPASAIFDVTGGKPYRAVFQDKTYAGEWTAEEIDSGKAGEPTITENTVWFEGDGTQATDPERIAAIEASIASKENERGIHKRTEG